MRVINKVLRAAFACFALEVEIIGQIASDAFLIGFERLAFGALTLLASRIVLFTLFTVHAFLLVQVKIFRRIATDTLRALYLVGCLSCAHALLLLIVVCSSFEAVLALFVCCIPESSVGTDIANLAIEVGMGLGAILAFVGEDIKDLALGARGAFKLLRIKVVRVVAGHASSGIGSIREVALLFVTDAFLQSNVVL